MSMARSSSEVLIKKRVARGNASRPNSVKSSGDESFDVLVRGLSRQHLAETGRSIGWTCNSWKAWMSGLDLGSSVDEEVLVAEIESDCDECDRDDYAREVSVVGPPLFTDDDRRSGPADHDQQSQGGPEKSKHSEVVVNEITKDVYAADVPSMFHQGCVRR